MNFEMKKFDFVVMENSHQQWQVLMTNGDRHIMVVGDGSSGRG